MTNAAFNTMFVLCLVAPPLTVVLGALLLLIPRTRGAAGHPRVMSAEARS